MLNPYLAISVVLAATLLAGCATSHKVGHEQIVTELKPIEDVPITVSYQGGVFYRVQLNNNLPDAIRLIWDECAYVTTTGKTIRILHIPNKNDLPQHPPAQQDASLIAPNSQFQAVFTGEEWLDCAKRGCTPQPKYGDRNARIYLAVSLKDKRIRWQGEIAFAPPKQP